jgi:hypothetical protein
MKVKKIGVVILAAVLALSGCTYPTGILNDSEIKSMLFNRGADNNDDNGALEGEDKSGSYLEAKGITLPKSQTAIYVNQFGYSSKDEKQAIFSEDYTGSTFRVVNAYNNQTVYSGKITATDAKTGDFTKVTKAGRYYIEADEIGRSYYFTISNNSNKELFVEMLDNFYSDIEQEESIIDVCFGMNTVIFAMQCNGEAFEIGSGIVNELLSMADILIAKQGKNGSISDDYEQTAAFCGIMAMCCAEFGKYDEKMESTYKEAALNAWEWLKTQKCTTNEAKSQRFYAAAQLFGLLDSKDYKTIAEQYLKNNKTDERTNNYYFERYSFYGTVAYMNSKGDIDKELCTDVMMYMLMQADEIADSASSDKTYKVGVTDIDLVFDNALQICFFNYLVPSREYTDMLDNTLDYIGGYNPEGINYIEDNTSDKNFEYKGIVLFALSNLVTED